MRVQHVRDEGFRREYGINVQRLYPTAEGKTPFGSSWCRIDPLKRTTPHQHDEGETFFIVRGHGLMTVGSERQELRGGDVVYIPPHTDHCLINVSAGEVLEFISVWWE